MRGAVTGSTSLLLRLMSLAGKLALSLFMGKFFALSALGLYGLAFGAVMLAVVGFGFRVDYGVSREILGMESSRQRRVGTEVAILFLLSFLVAGPFVLLGFALFGTDDFKLALLIYLLCGLEAYANFLYTVTIALRRAALANALFFIRSGAWTLPVMVISYFEPQHRTVGFVLGWWLAGVSASVLLNIWCMRRALIGPVTWVSFKVREVRDFCRSALLIWIGSVAITMGAYLDRFVLASFLTLQDVGVITFYTSFTTAALTLVQSATTSVTFPAMIERFDADDQRGFRREVLRTTLLALAIGFVILAGLGTAMPLMGSVLGKPELLAAYPAFVLLLVATLVRIVGETLYYGLFVQRQHRAIWGGNFLFFAVSLLFNLLLVPALGLVGVGIAAILAAAVIAGFRAIAYIHPGYAKGEVRGKQIAS